MWAHIGRGGLFVFWVLRRLRRASVGRMAASLAFTTLLGIVPLFTVALAYVARFPVFERWLDTLEPFLVKFLLPDSSSAVRDYLAEFTTKAAGVQGVGTAISLLVRPAEIAIATPALTMLYKLVPARRVPVRDALIGALLAATAFELAKIGFKFYIRQVPTYRIVYGALAALPLFLIWIYVSWIILLLGAAVTATLAERGGKARNRRRRA